MIIVHLLSQIFTQYVMSSIDIIYVTHLYNINQCQYLSMICRIVLRFLYTCLVVPAREGYATLHVVYMLYVVIATYFVRKWIMT